MHYVAVDGDDVGSKLEQHLFRDDINSVTEYAKRVSTAVSKYSSILQSCGYTIVFDTGDGVFAFSSEEFVTQNLPLTIDEIPFSIGVGQSPSNAVLALKKAKGLGKRQIVVIP